MKTFLRDLSKIRIKNFYLFFPGKTRLVQFTIIDIFFQEGRKIGYSGMPGFHMIASSPMRHDHDMPASVSSASGADIQSYEPPWKALCDFALHSDLDKLAPNVPQYQQIVNQVSSSKRSRSSKSSASPACGLIFEVNVYSLSLSARFFFVWERAHFAAKISSSEFNSINSILLFFCVWLSFSEDQSSTLIVFQISF